MGVIIAFGEEKVAVAVGSFGAKPKIRQLCQAPVRESGISGWERALRELWEENKLPHGKVTLVLPGSATSVKLMNAPDMPEKRMRELVNHEMQGREEQPAVADYMALGKDEEGHISLFCVSCPRDLVTQYLEMCARLKLKVDRITTALDGHLLLLRAMEEMRERSCIWLNFEGGTMLSVLIEDGKYRYSGRSRIFSEPGTIDFGTEVTRNISGTLQFQAASHSAHPVTDVYYAGCADDVFEVCLAGIGNLGLAVSRLPEPVCFTMALPTEGPQPKASDWLDCAGAMLRRGRALNLYDSYRRTDTLKAKSDLLHAYYTPALALLIVGMIVWAILLRINLGLMDDIDVINAWLNDPAIEAQYDDSLEKQAIGQQLADERGEIERLIVGLATYPQLDSDLLAEIARVGGDDVEMVITGFDAGSGELLFEAHSHAVIDIPGYVLDLQELDRFHTVEYTGYAYDEGEYILRLRCTLQADAGREEADA